ncbi:MAG: hypothetical protein Q4B10_08040 [Actinomycetaceae bacterium]|nr:hypothetical protein [Actinomycetaceae bacterium]
MSPVTYPARVCLAAARLLDPEGTAGMRAEFTPAETRHALELIHREGWDTRKAYKPPRLVFQAPPPLRGATP